MRRLYRTRFLIEPSSELEQERLLSVPAACLRWALGHEGMPLQDSLSELLKVPLDEIPRTESTDGKRIEVKSIGEPGFVEWAMRFSHLDRDDFSIRWTVEIAFREQESGALDTVCEVFVAREGGLVAPVAREPMRPNVVAELIQAFPCTADKRMSATAKSIHAGQLLSFVDFIQYPKRRFPVVLATVANRDERPLVRPDFLADRLSGLAHVYVAEDRHATRELEDVYSLPHHLNAWDGAIRVYWPGFSFQDDPRIHYLWVPARLEDLPESKRVLVIVRPIAMAAVASYDRSAPSWIALERKERQLRMELLRTEGGDLTELLELSEAEARHSETENEQLRSELAEAAGRLFERDQQIEALQLSIRELQKRPVLEERRVAPTSLENAVEYAREDFGEKLEFVLNSASSVEGNPFERPEEALSALGFLATTWRDAKTGQKPCADLDLELREQCGWKYQHSQSEVTMKRWENEYTIRHRGQKIWLGAHLATRSAKDPRYSLRIGFAWDDETQRVLVGYIGQHQRTSAT